MLPQLYEHPSETIRPQLSVYQIEGALTSICKQRSEDAICAPQMALRISLELLFLGRIRP
jgi:hypothetical protein